MTPPKVPAAAQQRTEAGAIAFLTFYFEEVNRGATAPGTVDLFALSDPECRACAKLQDTLRNYVSEGLHLRGNTLQVTASKLAPSAGPQDVPTAEKVIIDFVVDGSPQPKYRGDAQVGETEKFTLTRTAAIRWVDGAWEMFDMEAPNA